MHNGCILCGGVGVGKSHTAVGYYLQNEAPKPVYVITTAKKRDKQDWQFLWSEVGMHSDPELTMGAVVIVDSWENIQKYKEVSGAFFIFDEQRLVGTGAWVKAFYKIAEANRWIMLSATPGDNWLDYVPVFRANGFIKNITQFKEDHVVSRWTGRYYQVIGYRQVPRLVRWRNQLLVDMPYEKHTKRHTHYIDVSYDKDLVKELVTKRWHVYEERPLTDASELFRVTRKVVYSDTSRLEAVRELLKSHPKLIVFYNFDYELEMLRTLVQSGPKQTSSETDPSTTQESTTESSTSSQTVRPKTSISTKSSGKERSLLPETTESSSTPRSETSASTLSPTPSGTGSNESTTSSDPWDYLLSPEGMRENSLNSSYDGPTTSSDGTSLRHTSETSDDGSTPKRKPDGSLILEETWKQATGIPTNHPNSPWGTSQNETSLRSTGTLTKTSRSTPEIFSGPQRDGSSPIDQGQVSPTTSGSSSTTTESGRTGETLRTKTESERSSEKNSSPTCTETSDQTEETDECQHTSTESTATPASQSSSQGGGRTKYDTERLSGSLRKSISMPSSTESNRTSEPSATGRSSGSQPSFQVAEWNGHKHQEVPTTTSWVYLVQYVAGAEAWECTETDAICFFSMPYSYKIWSQAHGRIDRLNTSFSDLHYYVLFGGSYLERGVKASLSEKKTFNESAFAEKIGF